MPNDIHETGRAAESNGQPIARRAFLIDAATLTILGAGMLPRLKALAAMPARRWASPAPLVPNRPFNMVALGDSVMWGQGLAAEQKFTTQVQHWLEAWMYPRKVQRFVFARSGAVIGPCGIDADAPCVINRSTVATAGEIEVPASFAGEVPGSAPTILDQIDRAIATLPARGVQPWDVDLVIVDGGINDVNLQYILNPANSATAVRARTQVKAAGMHALVSRVASTFPSAKVAVLGYFPIVSSLSNPLEISPWLQLLGFATVAAPVLAGAAAAMGLPPGATATAAAAAGVGLYADLATKTQIFYGESTAALKDAVQRENTVKPYTSPAGMPNVRSPGHVVFVDPGFTPANSYAAPDSWLFKFSESTSDAVSAGRASACAAALGSPAPVASTGDVIKCQHASLGHPNPTGARAYASAIEAQLTPFLGDWMGLKKALVTVQGAPSMEPGALSTLSILVRDPDTSQPIAATIKIAQQQFPANRQFAVTLCPARVLGKTTSKVTDATSADNHVGVCASAIMVSASGFYDAVVGLSDLTNVRYQLPAPPTSNGSQPLPAPELAVDVTVGVFNQQTQNATLTVTARDSRTGEIKSGTVLVDDPRGLHQASGTTGRPISFKPCQEFDPTLKKFLPGGACTVRVTVPGYMPVATQAGMR